MKMEMLNFLYKIATDCKFLLRFRILELGNRVTKPSYLKWCHNSSNSKCDVILRNSIS